MKSDAERRELFDLFGALADGTITPSAFQRLQETLRVDGEARALWFLHCDLEQGLARNAQASRAGSEAPVSAPALSSESRRAPRMPARRWLLALAASIVVAAVGATAFFLPLTKASAASLVRRALDLQATALDRCYRVDFGSKESSPRDAVGQRETLLWSRGDRFCTETRVGGEHLAWGRDEAGCVWFALTQRLGGSFDADEVPARLAEGCELRSLQADHLLRALLEDFDLRRESGPDGSQVVTATLKPGHVNARYRSARLELDSESGALRRVEILRVAPGRAPVPVTFTLVETGLRDDAGYTLRGHVDADAAVYDRHSPPGQRGRTLAAFVVRLREP